MIRGHAEVARAVIAVAIMVGMFVLVFYGVALPEGIQ